MKNRSVLVTGSSKGLGEELALVFAGNGYDIILHGRDKKDLTRVKEKVVKNGVNCYVSRGDLTQDKVIKQLFLISKQKNISVLINNAALPCPFLPLQNISDKEINNILITNLIAPIKLTKQIYSLFLKRGCGTIININSISGLENQELRSIYCASKWGLRGFIDTFRLEAREHNVRVIGVYPSRIKTRPHFTQGMKTKDVAGKIFDIYKHSNKEEIILDGRH
ncbi:MAG: SDR family oxidoreductase [Candidatus Omnitrophota bacterium]|nr:SDR family oxidoreductase [Candidatus Omnitrophota bacterium]